MRAAGVTSPVPTMGDVGREHACQRRSPGSERHPIPLAEQLDCPRMTYLESGWQFGSHHFFTVESATRSAERRVGKASVSACRSRWSPNHEKEKQDRIHVHYYFHLNYNNNQE